MMEDRAEDLGLVLHTCKFVIEFNQLTSPMLKTQKFNRRIPTTAAFDDKGVQILGIVTSKSETLF